MNGSVAGGGVSEEVIRLTRGPSGEAGAAALRVGPRRGGGGRAGRHLGRPFRGWGGGEGGRGPGVGGAGRGVGGSPEPCGSGVLPSPGWAARRRGCAGGSVPSTLLRKGTASCVSGRRRRRTWSSAITARRNAVGFLAGSEATFRRSARLLVLSSEATGVLPCSAAERPEPGAFLRLVGCGTS